MSACVFHRVGLLGQVYIHFSKADIERLALCLPHTALLLRKLSSKSAANVVKKQANITEFTIASQDLVIRSTCKSCVFTH